MIAIESRLTAVERQLRFQRAVIAGLLVALVALVGWGAGEDIPDVIRARRFEVVNPEGKVVVGAGAFKYGGLLTLFNAEGQAGVRAIAGPYGGQLYILNKTGEEVVQLLADLYDVGYVRTYDRQGNSRTLKPR
jgi:hypothetical protein